MAIIGQDITVYRGSDLTLDFTNTSGEDITGWTIVLTVARAAGSTVKAIASVTATVISGELGMYRFFVPAAQTDIRPADYLYDVWRTDAGEAMLLAMGTMTLSGVPRLPTP